MVATSGDTGGAAVEAFRGRAQVDVVVLFPQRPGVAGAAAHDDDRDRRQRPRDRHRRHLRRLPGAGEGDVQPRRLPRHASGSPASTRSTSPASSPRWSTTSSRPSALGAPHRKVAFTVPDRQFRRRVRRLCRRAHGASGRPAHHRDQRQRHPGAHARERHLRGPRGRADHLAVDGHPGVVELRAAAVRGERPRSRSRCAARWPRSPSRGGSPCPARALGEMRAAVHRRPRLRGRDRGDDPHHAARDRLPDRSPHRRRHRGRREGDARSRRPDGGAVDRPSGEVSRCRRGRLRRPARPAGLARRPRREDRALTVLPADQAAVEAHILAHSRAAREGVAA